MARPKKLSWTEPQQNGANPPAAQPVLPAQPVQPGYPVNYPAPAPGYPQPVARPIPVQPGYPQPGFPPPGYGQQPYPAPAYPQPVPQYPQPPAPAQPYAAPAPGYPQPVAPAYPAAGYARPIPVAPAPVPVPVPIPVPTPVQPVAVQPVPVQPVPVRPVQAQPARAPQPVVTQPVQPAAPRPAAARPIPVGAARPIPVAPKPNQVVQAPDDEGEEAPPDIEEKIVRNAPPWLISLIIHVVAIFVMAFWYLASNMDTPVELEIVYAEELGVQLEDDRFDSGLMQNLEVAEPLLSKDEIAAENPLAAPSVVEVSLEGTQSTDTLVAPSIGLALTGREKGAKQALLGKYGGNATTEAAVRLGLEWLKRNQEKKGTWSLVGPYPSGASIENRCAATAMALLAFQGAGHTHQDGDFKKEVAAGWKALLAMQDKDGVFYHEGVHHQQLYAQAQATIAICELYGMTKDPAYKKPAQLAVDYAIKIQAPEGGWRYTPGSDSDTSVTGWFVMALQSAMMAGLEVPSPNLEKISKFLDTVQSDNGTRYAYRPGGGATETMTAEGLLCRQYLNWAHSDPRLADGVKYLLNNPISWDISNTNVYYWYYATQVCHHMEGDAWKEWNNVMRQVIPKAQEKTGKEAGSWSPSNDRWGGHGGRLYETCLCIYMLEVYYRHLPIYKWKGR